jgi:hypothetical protein
LLSSFTRWIASTSISNAKECMTRRLVPIYKEGDRKEAGNYKNILVASIFAKVLKGLLGSKLSRWIKAHKTKAISCAGYKAHNKTLDHVLCL